MGTETINRSSQMDLTLDTGNGYFDQAMGISQKIINKNLESVFNKTEKMHRIKYEHSRRGWIIQGDLEAPRIMLQAGQLGINMEIYYQIRFKTGTFTGDAGSELPLNNWVITAECNLKDLVLNDNPDDTEEELEEKQTHLVEVLKTFKLRPGDYSIQRLFATIGTAKWSNPHPEYTTCGLDGKGYPIPWSKWKDMAKNKIWYADLSYMLQNWCANQEAKGLTTIGVKFCVPPLTGSTSRPPSFVPTALFAQIQPYRTAKYPLGAIGVNDGIGDFNCVTYCENVKNRELPDSVEFLNKKPFALPASVTGSKDVDGTFVMDRRLFLEGAVLKFMQGLVQGCEILVDEDDRYIEGNDSSTICPRFTVGLDNHRHRKPLLLATDPHFELKKHPTTPNTYYFYHEDDTKEHRDNPYVFPNKTQIKDHVTSYSKGTSSVTVTYYPGTPKLKVEGKSIYYRKACWAWNPQMTDHLRYWEFERQATWDFDIVLTPGEAGCVVPVLQRTKILDEKLPENVLKEGAGPETFKKFLASGDRIIVPDNLRYETTKSDAVGKSPTQLPESFSDSLEENMKTVLGAVAFNFATRFLNNGKFVYPGNGHLDFSNLVFNNYGDLIAMVTYRPLGDAEWITVPLPQSGIKIPITLPPPPQTEKKPEPIMTRPDRKPVVLDYLAAFKYDPKTNFGYLTLRAANRSGRGLAFGFIRIAPLINETGAPLFRPSTKWVAGTVEEPEASAQPEASKEPQERGIGEIVEDAANTIAQAITGPPKPPTDNTWELKHAKILALKYLTTHFGGTPERPTILIESSNANKQFFKMAEDVEFTWKCHAAITAPAVFEVLVYESWRDLEDPEQDIGVGASILTVNVFSGEVTMSKV